MSERPHWMSADMAALEIQALHLLDEATARGATDTVIAEWIVHVRPDRSARARFPSEFRQAAFVAALRAVNADPASPRIYALGRLEHVVENETIPGTNYGHGNPDCIYRLMPVGSSGTYRLSGRFPGKRPVATEISLIDQAQGFLGNVSSRDLAVDGEGRFSVTLSPEPAKGCSNHLLNVEGAYNLCVRDVHGDGLTEFIAPITIERLDRPAHTTDRQWSQERGLSVFPGLLQRAVGEILGFENQIIRPKPPNVFTSPATGTADMLLPSQAFSMGRYHLDPGMTLVFTVSLGGAGYFILPATNAWGGLGDFLAHVGALNNFHAHRNDDGTFTFVLSMDDPGVANWIDPDGMNEGLIVARWLDFRGSPHNSSPYLTAQLVPIAQLNAVLPKETLRYDSAARTAQRALHKKNYAAMKG